MAHDKLSKLIDNCRAEMGADVFKQFSDDLSGRRTAPPRQRKHTCGLCEGSGEKPDFMGGGKCEGCDGTGKF